MHWPIIRLIWLREMRDLLRDRRTLFMIFLLPVALYPVLGIVGLTFVRHGLKQESLVGIYGLENLPKPATDRVAAAWFSLTPCGTAPAMIGGAAAFADAI